MTARGILAGLALLLAVPTAAACARVVPGNGTLAAGAQAAGPTPVASATPSPSPSEPGSSASPSPSGSATGGGTGGTGGVCQALDQSAVQAAFGASVTFSRSQSSGCKISADDGRFMTVAVFDHLTLTGYERDGSTELTVGGHPAVHTPTTIIYVASSTDPDEPGVLAAYFSGLRDDGDPIATKVLELLLPTYGR